MVWVVHIGGNQLPLDLLRFYFALLMLMLHWWNIVIPVVLSILDKLIYVEINFNHNQGMLDYEILYFSLHKCNRITQKSILA